MRLTPFPEGEGVKQVSESKKLGSNAPFLVLTETAGARYLMP